MAKIAKPPIPIKMYRHFAIITIAITLLLGFFANGENSEAVVAQIEEHQQQAELERISAERTGANNELTLRDGTPPNVSDGGGGGGGDVGGFGNPSMRLTASNSSVPLNSGTPMGPGRRALPGYSSEFLDSLSADDYQKLLETVRKAGMLSADDRARTRATLERMSSRRAGAATQGE